MSIAPAPGNRAAGSGPLIHVGNRGYSWSSSIAGSLVHSVGFDTGLLDPQRIGYRADGFQLRCLQE